MSAPVAPLTAETLAEALRQAVLARDFGATPDMLEGGGPVRHFPSLDLAVVAFPEGGAPVAANVLFSRDLPQGWVARMEPGCGPVANVRYLADQTDALFNSVAWQPEAQWNAMAWTPLPSGARQIDPQAPRFVQPYPASLLKLMVLVAVAHCVDRDEVHWDDAFGFADMTRPVRTWAMDMMAQSSNEATSAMVALLHRCGLIRREGGHEVHNGWHAWMARHGLHTLRLADTQPDGGWQNRAGAGVGHLQMTAWDTVRLLWLLDPLAPPAPWPRQDHGPLLSAPQLKVVLDCLAAQGVHGILSSALLAGLPGWVPGIPAQLPAQWIDRQGHGQVAGDLYPGDLRAAQAEAPLRFAHKTGTTENYASNAGIVTGRPGLARRHYLVAVLTNLGTRYAPHPLAFSTWRLPALGAALDAWLAPHLEPSGKPSTP